MVVVFATSSDIEASVVMALLDSHGIEAIRASGNTQGIWPMTVSALGEIRVGEADSAAEDARRIIDSHRQDVGSRVVRLRDEFDELQTRIDYRFRDRGLLEHALTHKSRAAEDASGGVADNESLEFLGDAVLGLVVADALFHQYPTYDEGQKSKIKAAVVSTTSLARHAEILRLGEHLILGRGEEKTGGRFKQALLADAYEALIAAIYLDGGLEAAEAFLRRELKDALDEGSAQTFARDYKSALQEQGCMWSGNCCPITACREKPAPITARRSASKSSLAARCWARPRAGQRKPSKRLRVKRWRGWRSTP